MSNHSVKALAKGVNKLNLADCCTEPDGLPSFQKVLDAEKGFVVITSSLGIDVFDSHDPVDDFVATASGSLSPVRTLPAAEWDTILVSLALPDTCALDVDDVQEVSKAVTQVVSSGCTPYQAIRSLMEGNQYDSV